jgi:putative pyruvate formate lyase activating enzyme
MAKPKLNIPIVYNSSGYDKVDLLKNLDGLVDIYLPDFKYADMTLAKKYSNVSDYFEVAFNAISEMRRQQPKDIFAGKLMKKGVIVRHLILPNAVQNSLNCLDAITMIDKSLYISVMSQYFVKEVLPKNFPELNRKITKGEYDAVIEHFHKIGLKNGFTQHLDSATKDYVPNFDLEILRKQLAK